MFRGCIYTLIDKYPGSKFVLLVREDKDKFARSMVNKVGGRAIELHRQFFNNIYPTDLHECAKIYHYETNRTITNAIKDTDHKIMTLERIEEEWEDFWEWIGAEGDYHLSLLSWKIPRNTTEQNTVNTK